MGMIRELLQQIAERRAQTKTSVIAHNKGLERKPGFGNYGPKGTDLITVRSMHGKLKNVQLHPMGKKPVLPKTYMPPVDGAVVKRHLMGINKKKD